MITIGIAKVCNEIFYLWIRVGAFKLHYQRITMTILETTSYFIIYFFFNDKIGGEIIG